MRSGRDDLGGSKIGGRNITEYLQPRNTAREKSSCGAKREADPIFPGRRPMTQRKKQVSARRGTAGVRDPASKERFSEITSGSSRGQQGWVQPARTLGTRLNAEGGESPQ